MNLDRVLLLFLMLILALSGCNINNEPLGVRRELVGEGDVGKVLKTSLFSTPEDTSITVTLNTGNSPYLAAGEAQNVFSEFLIAFPRAGNGEIKKAKLILPIHLVAGEGGGYTPTVHRVTRAWKEDSVTANNLQAPYFDPAIVGQAQFLSLDSLRKNIDTDTLSVDLDSTYVKTLASDSVNVLFKSLDRNVVFEFHSRQSGARVPVLEVLQSRSGLADTTLRVTPLADAFVFHREMPLPNDRFYCGSGEKHQTYLRFTPLDTMPANASVSRAILTLNIDHDNTFITQDGFTCAIYLVQTKQDSNKVKGDTLYFDLLTSATAANTISKDATQTEFNLSSSVQIWLSLPGSNVGLTVEPVAPFRDLQRVAIHSAANAALAPKLTIDYTTPPVP